MPDQSHLDERYFVDRHVYNCPFCNRRHVSYSIIWYTSFDWTDSKKCHVYFAGCHSCGKASMHLSYTSIHTEHIPASNPPRWRFTFPKDGKPDDLFFYSVPTSFFVLDNRIPRVLRNLLIEAEGSLKSNYLTGASACARKLVYELTAHEEVYGDSYEERIKNLKVKHPEVEQTYFDTLLTIQQVTSSKVHENAYDGWESNHLRLILASLRKALHELYVAPALRADGRREIENLKKELLGDATSTSPRGGAGKAS